MKPIATPDPIIAQAVKLFAERGYAETNLPSIAKAANVAVGTIYRHFKGKEDILNTAFTDIMHYFIFGAFNGKMPDITNAALDSSKEAAS